MAGKNQIVKGKDILVAVEVCGQKVEKNQRVDFRQFVAMQGTTIRQVNPIAIYDFPQMTSRS